MATALITGGTGFVGSHIAAALISSGHRARVLRRESSTLRALEGLGIASVVDHAFGEVNNLEALTAAMAGCEWVFHVAAVADYWRADKTRMYSVNVEGTRTVLQAARRAGVRRIVLTSSGAAIGQRSDGQPADETIRFNLNPARFPYGHSKFLAEAEAYRAVRAGMDVVIVNPAIIMGPGDINQISGSTLIELRRGIIPAIPAGGANFIDVRDVAAMHIAAAEHGARGERYILGAYNAKWRELMPIAAAIVGVRGPIMVLPRAFAGPLGALVDVLRALRIPVPIDGNQMRLSAQDIFYDCDKAWAILGRPQFSLHQMLADTHTWYAQNGFIS
jgi:dihydroflavonol-4-reductase